MRWGATYWFEDSMKFYLAEVDHQGNNVRWCYTDGSWKQRDKLLGQGWLSFTGRQLERSWDL